MSAAIELLRPPARGEQVLAHATVGRTVRVWPSIIRDYTREVYQQRSHWSLAIALGAAIAIYANVIVIVGLHSERPVAAEAPFSELILELVLESGPSEPIQPQQPDEDLWSRRRRRLRLSRLSKKRRRRRRIAFVAAAPLRRGRGRVLWGEVPVGVQCRPVWVRCRRGRASESTRLIPHTRKKRA